MVGRGGSFLSNLLLSVLCVLLSVSIASSHVFAIPQAIEAPLAWTTDSGAGGGDASGRPERAQGRRIAVLLIDRSESMRRVDPEANGRSRWQLVIENLTRCLDELERTTPGIEVEIRFFDEKLDCVDPMRFILSGNPLPDGTTRAREAADMVARLEVPRLFNGTALHQAVSVVAGGFAERFKQSDYDWGFFVVYSDGKDTSSPSEFGEKKPRSWIDAARRLGDTLARRGGRMTVVPVGPDALEMVRTGTFEGFEAGDIADSLPKPPPPPCRVALRLGAGFDGVVTTGRLLRANESIEVKLEVESAGLEGACAGADVFAAADLEVRVSGGSPFRLEGSSVLPGAGGTLRCVPTGDPGDGAVLRLEVTPRGKAGSGLVVRTAPVQVAASFRPAVAPPDPQSWSLSIPEFVRINSRATISVDNLDDRFEMEWSLDGVVESTKPSFSHLFDRAGVVMGVIEAASTDGRKGRREFRVEVVDGSFSIDMPAKAAVGKPCELSVRDSKAAEATYEWEIDGTRTRGERITIVPGSVGEIPVRCTATTSKGGFLFQASAVLEVAGRPRMLIAEPDSMREGDRTLRVVCRSFDVGDDARIRLSLDGREVGTKQPEPFEGGGRTSFEVPLGQAYWNGAGATAELKAEVIGQSGDFVADIREIPVIPIEGLSVQLRSPKPGAIVEFGVNTKIELDVGAPDAAVRSLVESMHIRVLDSTGRSLLLGDAAAAGIERAAPDFSVSIQPDPSVHRPPFRVEARLSGSALARREDWISAGEIGAELATAQFTITTMDEKPLEAVAYEPLSVKLNGIPAGEAVSVEWSLDGRELDGVSAAATLPGSEPGQHEVVAIVVRGNGARETVGPVSLFCRSSLRLSPASSVIEWEGGSPPRIVVEILASSEEMRMIESVRWSGATALEGNGIAAETSFPVAGGGGEGDPLQVTAEVFFRDGVKPREKLVATYTPAPAAVEITRFEVSVGGRSPSDRAGGAVVAVLETRGVVGRTELRYSYTPSEKAQQRGFEPIIDEPLPAALVVDDEADGSWMFEARVTSYSGQDLVTKQAAFENTRRLDWFGFGAFIAVSWIVLAALIRLASDNAGLWWGVRFCRQDQLGKAVRDSDFIRPFVFWRGRSVDRPRWNLLTKKASMPITRISGFSTRPQWRWFTDRLLDRDPTPDAELSPTKVRGELEAIRVRWNNRQAEPMKQLGANLVDGDVDVDRRTGVRTETASPMGHGSLESEPIHFQRKDAKGDSAASRLMGLLFVCLVVGFPLSLAYGVLYVL